MTDIVKKFKFPNVSYSYRKNGWEFRMRTGFYWYQTIFADGTLLENSPSVLWFNDEQNSVQVIGYDMDLEFCPSKFKILGRVQPCVTPKDPSRKS